MILFSLHSSRKYRQNTCKIVEKKDHTESFKDIYGSELNLFFQQHPKVIAWGGASPNFVLCTIKGKNSVFTEIGYVTFDENGRIARWDAKNGRISFKHVSTELSYDALVAQVTGLLRDNNNAARYCEQIAVSLLDDGDCVFNAPYGLHMKENEYTERYHSQEWKEAWIEALLKEFQAKEVREDEAAGIGCFRLIAI